MDLQQIAKNIGAYADSAQGQQNLNAAFGLPSDVEAHVQKKRAYYKDLEDQEKMKAVFENFGGEITQEQIAMAAKVNPDLALKLVQMKQQQEAASAPQLGHKFNPATGEDYYYNKRTNLPIDIGGGSRVQPVTSGEDMSPITVPPLSDTPTSAPLEIQPPPQGLTPVGVRDWNKTQMEIVAADRKMAAKTLNEKKGVFNSVKSKMPELVQTINELSRLSNDATYTLAGQGADWVAKQVAGVTTEGAKARTNYEAIVSNQVLPLLKDTFGAAFTVEEGNALRATLGDPDMSPPEKHAVLQSFINQKISTLRSMGRDINQDTSFLDEIMSNIDIGKKETTRPTLAEIDAAIARKRAQQ